jgi:hypothetical protein
MDKQIVELIKQRIREGQFDFCDQTIPIVDIETLKITQLPCNKKKWIVHILDESGARAFPVELDKQWNVYLSPYEKDETTEFLDPESVEYKFRLKYNPYQNEILISQIVLNKYERENTE